MQQMKSLIGIPPKQVLALALAERAKRRSLRQVRGQPLSPSEYASHSSLVTNPNHPFHELTKPSRYKIYYGGRGSAKSWAAAEALVRRAAHAPLRILCTREYQNSIADSVHRLLQDTIIRLGMSAWFDITEKSIRSKIGAEFIFKGLHNNVQEIKSTEGVDICWVEEAQTVSKASWKVLIPTIRDKGSEIWITFNPDQEEDATYQMFVVKTPPNAIRHHVNFDQNPFFAQTELVIEHDYALRLIAEADNDDERKQAQAEYDNVWLGACATISNEIIFAGKYVVDAFPDDLWKEAPRLLYGSDWGFSQDPTVLMRDFIINNTLYIEYEAYGIGVDFAGNMVDEQGELEQLFRSIPESDRWPIKADNARPETISFVHGLGFNCSPADKWKGSVEDGIAHIRGFKKVIIHPRCKHTIHEFKTYRYKIDKDTDEPLPIIVDKNNHCIDAIRYSLDGYIQRRGNVAKWLKLGQALQGMPQ